MDFRKKTFHSRVMACKSQYTNLIELTEQFLCTFEINEQQKQPERQLVSRKLLQMLSTGASCQRPARYNTAYAAYG